MSSKFYDNNFIGVSNITKGFQIRDCFVDFRLSYGLRQRDMKLRIKEQKKRKSVILEEKEKLQLWNNSFNTSPFATFNEDNDDLKKRWKNENTFKTTNKSILSLHIATYENSIETAASDLFGENENIKGLQKEKFGSIKASKQCFTDSFKSQNPFEFPRQQNGNQRNESEVMQYSASQRLIGSNRQWPCTIGISKKEKKATIYIFYNDKGEAIEYQKHDETRVRCIRCKAKKNFNFDFKFFEDDPAQCQCGKPKKSSDVKKDQFRSQFLLQISGNLPYQALINENEKEEMLRQFIVKYNSMYTEKYHEHPSTTTPERFEKTIHSALMNSRYDKNEMKKLEKPEIEIPDETGGDDDEMEEENLGATDEEMTGTMDKQAFEETGDAAENGLETSYQNLSLNGNATTSPQSSAPKLTAPSSASSAAATDSIPPPPRIIDDSKVTIRRQRRVNATEAAIPSHARNFSRKRMPADSVGATPPSLKSTIRLSQQQQQQQQQPFNLLQQISLTNVDSEAEEEKENSSAHPTSIVSSLSQSPGQFVSSSTETPLSPTDTPIATSSNSVAVSAIKAPLPNENENPESPLDKLLNEVGPIMEIKDFEEQYLVNKYSKRIGEGSFGTVFLNELKNGGKTAVKVINLDGDSQCADGIFELKLMKSINKLGSIFLMELYDAKVFHGILTEKKKKAAKEKTKTPKLALLLSVAGTEEIEDFEIFNKEEMKSVIIQTSMAMATGEKKEFEHRDAHVSNIRVQREEGQFEYILNGVKYIVAKNGIKITLIDFGKSRIKDENEVLFYDWKTDQTLFGQNERYPEDPDLHFEIYDKMRQINGDDWASYNPKSNVLWIQYLVEKLTGFNEGMQASSFPPCKIIDKKGHHIAENERKEIAQISEQIKECKSATEVVEIMMASQIFENVITHA